MYKHRWIEKNEGIQPPTAEYHINEREYWTGKFQGEFNKSLFPYDFKSKGKKDRQNGVEKIVFPNSIARTVIGLSKGHDIRLHILLTTGLVLLLSRYTRETDITIGVPIYRQESDEEFINTVLAVRSFIDDNMTVKDVILTIRENIRDAVEHQNYPIQTLVYQLQLPFTEDNFPLFDVAVLLHNIHDESYLQHINHNITFSFERSGESLAGTIQYNTALYRQNTIKQIVRYFGWMAAEAFADLNKAITQLELMTPGEKKRILEDFCTNPTDYPADKTIDALFEEQVAIGGDDTAVVFEGSGLSYNQLNDKANKLAALLSSKGVTADTIVGIMVEASLDMPVGILGIIKAGGAYLPIDNDYPEDRKTFIINDSRARILLTARQDAHIPGVEIINMTNYRTYRQQAGGSAAPGHGPGSLAYVLYTSGSTGRPKGVLVEHRSVVRLVKNTNYAKFKKGGRILQTGALDFDASTFEIWGSLLNGLSLYLADKNDILMADTLRAALHENDIDTIWMTSALFNQMLDEDMQIFSKLEQLLVGGDVLSPVHISELREKFQQLTIINGYGPTENTTFSTTYTIRETSTESIPIGKPIANSTAYVLDCHNRLLPPGIAGELCVGGDGLARGYLNNPQLTWEKFIHSVFGQDRLYRTGDLVRWHPDGNIEFLGRLDYQVKIRGFRIEPGEIENHIVSMAEINDAAVVVRGDESREKYLCAYIVPENTENDIDTAGLRQILSNRLPEFMIPAYFVQLEHIPLTRNKKVDRSALPEPEKDSGVNYIAPRDDIEKKIVDFWSGLLGMDREKIGIDADFFEFGGHSLKATMLMSRIHKEMDIKIPLSEIFSTPTVRGIAQFVKQNKKERFEAIKAVELKEYFHLSPAQKRLFILQQINPGLTNYNVPVALELEGDIDITQLETAFAGLITRHESFRTSFFVLAGEPVQRIHPNAGIEIDDCDLTGNDNDILTIIHDFVRPFDLSQAPLMRLGLLKCDRAKHILIIDMHHIITDGTSTAILAGDFMALYEGRQLPPLTCQYKDFSQWQNNLTGSERLESQEEYWVKEFTGQLPILQLPADFSRPPVQSFEGASIIFSLNAEDKEALIQLGRENEITLYMLLLAAYNIFISKITMQDDIIVGSPIAGRQHENLGQIVGMFVNMLALRNFPRKNKPVNAFLKEVKRKTLSAYENQDYQFEQLINKIDVNRDTSRHPLFETAFALQNFEIQQIHVPGLELKPFPIENRTSKFDLTLHALETDTGLEFSFEYCTKLFERETVERFSNYYIHTLTSIIADPAGKISEITIMPEHEKKYLLEEFNAAGAGYPRDKTLHSLFEDQAENFPDTTALVFTGNNGHRTMVTYALLNEKANRLARLLRQKNVGSDVIVALLMHRSIEMITSILAVLKAGGAYLPIEPSIPEKRILAMLEDSRVKILLTHSDIFQEHSYQAMNGTSGRVKEVVFTGSRPPIGDFDALPLPDRSMVDYDKYSRYIGQAMVKNGIALQTTRGCPYNCLYCHKIWPKNHLVRSAENIFSEVKQYYEWGVRKFIIIDDIFNLDKTNSSRFFQLIIDNGLDLQLFFPNGLRGDILTRDYIDLMVNAGTVSLALALETASPRLQKLIQKNMNLDKLRDNIRYFCEKYPQVILELFTMHGFPSETEEEANMTLDFIKRFKWIHFPYVHILKIYPNTGMAKLALENGISDRTIQEAETLAYHELSDTLPFNKSFTLKYQAEFLNGYFLDKDRLRHVLPYQLAILSEDELLQKYNSYLPVQISDFAALLKFAGLTEDDLGSYRLKTDDVISWKDFNRHTAPAPLQEKDGNAYNILLLDLSQFFSGDSSMLYDVVEPPLGLMYIMTCLKQRFGNKVNGKIAKSRIDFDNYHDLKTVLDEFKPDLIGIRTLSFYKDFFLRTVNMIRQWGFEIPIVTGGPYATCDYETILQDSAVDLVIVSEGERTMEELVEIILEKNGRFPDHQELKHIQGLAFANETQKPHPRELQREILLVDALNASQKQESPANLEQINQPTDLAYVIYTSGSTGKPKGALIEHRNVVQLLFSDTSLFDFNNQDTWTMFHSYSFDFSVWEMYGALLYGGRLVLIPSRVSKEPRKYLELLKEEGVTILNQTPSVFYAIMKEELAMTDNRLTLRYIIFGGEALEPARLKEWQDRYPGTKLINMYGITETTVHVTYKEITGCDIRSDRSNIGKPIPTLDIYITDEDGSPVPVGVAGEMLVGGEGVCRGYLNRPRLTAEKFPSNPYKKNGTLYSSGDLARLSNTGDLVYMGRIDHQVKIRGFRIELGEIESLLSAREDIRDVTVLTHRTLPGEGEKTRETGNYLCAYIVPARSVEISDLRDYLRRYLPDYMIPSYFVELEKIPITPNGKIDRKALPGPQLEAGGDGVAPRDDLEIKMAELWSEILGIKNEIIGIDNDFFELGGHSLRANLLVSHVHEAFDIKLPLTEVFNTPTIRGLSAYIKRNVKETYHHIETAPVKDLYASSAAQKRLFFLYQLNKDSINYNIPLVVKIEGQLDLEKLEISFREMIHRHESFRTSFVLHEDEPYQEIHRDVPFSLERTDLSHLDDKQGKAYAITANFVRPFDLSAAPLMRAGVIRLDTHEFVLMLNIHHIIADGTSMGIFIDETLTLYRGGNVPVNRLQYKDYAEWQSHFTRSPHMRKQEEYWLNRLQDCPTDLELPSDYPRPGIKDFAGAKCRFQVDPDLTARVKQVTMSSGTTLYMMLLAVFNVLLGKYSGSRDIIVGTPVTGRTHTDLHRLIGLFANLIAMRNYPDDEKSFSQFLEEVKTNSLDAFQHQDYQFDALVLTLDIKPDPGRHPLFEAVFAMQNMDFGEAALTNLAHSGEMNVSLFEYASSTTQNDLILSAFESGNTISMCLEYATSLYKESTAREITGQFLQILQTVANEMDVKIKDISVTCGSFMEKAETIGIMDEEDDFMF